MKKFSTLSIMLALLLSSCSSMFTPPPISTTTPTSTITPSPTSTSTPTITPSPTMTPTPTPEGATRYDSKSGYYTKTTDGKIYYWIPVQITATDVENGIKGHWFETRMAKGSINLVGYGENLFDVDGFEVNMNVYFIENYRQLKNEGYLIHPSEPSDFVTKSCPQAKPPCDWIISASLPSAVTAGLWKKHKYYGMNKEQIRIQINKDYNNFKTSDDYDRYFQDHSTFISYLKKGGTIKIGEDKWQPRKGYDVYWIDYDEATKDPTFGCNNRLSGNTYCWKIMVVDEKLVAILATTEESKIEDRLFRRFILGPLQAALDEVKVDPLNVQLLFYQEFAAAAGSDLTVAGIPITTNFIEIIYPK